MASRKLLGALLILLSILLISMSFGHDYVDELITASTLSVSQDRFEVTPNSQVIISFSEYSTWGTLQWNFNLYGNGIDLWSPKVWIDYHETYHGSFTITAPGTPGTYTYYLKPYMYKDGSQIGHSEHAITIVVTDPQPTTFTLTTKVIDSNSNPLSGAEVSINTGVIGTTDSTGTVTKSDLSGSYTVTVTKESYNSDSDSVSMTQDQSITLTLSEISTICPTLYDPICGVDGKTYPNDCVAELEGVEIDYIGECIGATPTDTSGPIVQSTATPITTYAFVIEVLDTNDPQEPITNAKVMINGKQLFTNPVGKVSYMADVGESLSVVITKDGYNTFEKTYSIDSDTLVKVTLPPSGGDFFINLDFTSRNPFYDPDGILNTVPLWLAVISTLLLIAGIYLIIKQEDTP